jgi:hypothetical protein
MLVRPEIPKMAPIAVPPAPALDIGKRTVRLMDASTNLPLGSGSLVGDKVYIPPDVLKLLRED